MPVGPPAAWAVSAGKVPGNGEDRRMDWIYTISTVCMPHMIRNSFQRIVDAEFNSRSGALCGKRSPLGKRLTGVENMLFQQDKSMLT